MTSDRAPHKISKWGGVRANSGGSREGAGRPYRKPTPWSKDTDLTSSKGIDALLCRLVEKTWRGSVLDPRTVGALNNTIKLLLELRGWMKIDPDIDLLPAHDPVDYEAGKYRGSLFKDEEETSESPVDYVKIIDLILAQFPFNERDRILEKAKEQYLSRKAPLVSHT